MNVYERQLRDGLAVLMMPGTNLATRQAQIDSVAALLTVSNAGHLLAVIDELRGLLTQACGFLFDPEAEDFVEEIEVAIGERPERTWTTAIQNPIPANVAWNVRKDRFVEASTGKEMGYDFMLRWAARASEFPQTTGEPS